MGESIYQIVNDINLEQDARLLKIMAHPMRLKLIHELSKHKALNVNQLTGLLNIPQSTVSQHLSKMRGDVLKRDRHGIEAYYSIDNKKVEEIINLLNSI